MRPARPTIPTVLGCVSLLALAGCGGGSSRALDESGDLGSTSGQEMSTRVVEMPTGLANTQWRFTTASCTEGNPNLGEGFASTLRVEQDGEALLLNYDNTYASGCTQTVLQRVAPPPSPGELRTEEVARVAVPSTPECFGQPEPPRPGEVRRLGRGLQVLVQRSRLCNGFEVTMTYEPVTRALLTNDEIARRYVAHITRGDADRIGALFSTISALVESQTVTETGDPYRHEGREAITQYFRESFAGAPWRSMRVVALEPGATPQQTVLRWEYMDPRLAQPFAGHDTFTVAAGEIFEEQRVLDSQPVPLGASAPAAPATSAPAASAPAAH